LDNTHGQVAMEICPYNPIGNIPQHTMTASRLSLCVEEHIGIRPMRPYLGSKGGIYEERLQSWKLRIKFTTILFHTILLIILHPYWTDQGHIIYVTMKMLENYTLAPLIDFGTLFLKTCETAQALSGLIFNQNKRSLLL
jgi:hypothetical protein